MKKKYFWLNKRVVRYGLFILGLLILSFSIQLFVQNFNINKTIKDLQNQQVFLSGQTFWLNHYYEPFLKSKYATIIFNHSNSVALDNEVLIKIKPAYLTSSDKINIKTTATNNINWRIFFSNIFGKFF